MPSLDKEVIVFSALILIVFIILLKIVIKKKVCRECGTKLKTVKIVGETKNQWFVTSSSAEYGPMKDIKYKFICEKCNKEYSYQDL